VFRRLRALVARVGGPLRGGARPQCDGLEQALLDYAAAEDALRAFTDRNFGRLCAICARWTLLAAQSNGTDHPTNGAVEWRLSSWVTNCCNANHALESMSDESLAGIVASRAEGKQWWRRVKRAEGGPCVALTGEGCALRRGRPELCNRYFCEAVRDYLWAMGGERHGAQLAARLDALQKDWTRLYDAYGAAVADGRRGGAVDAQRLRRTAGRDAFLRLLETFDREIAACARPVEAPFVSDRLFKVSGERTLYEPFFEREVAAIGGSIRREERDGA
jgi:hypothetical protein